jgi:chorismate--pyruvate lyase
VKIQQNRSHPRQQWLKKPMLCGAYRKWLIDNGSLTARLQQRYAKFAVNPVAVKYAKPINDEATLLHLPAYKAALIREVLLIGNNQPVVFAHSVIPRASLRGAWNGLGRLGNKPLGATLFANPKVKRTPLEYKKLPKHHPISMRVSRMNNQLQLVYSAGTTLAVAEHMQTSPKALWARRSIFSLNCARILVTEVFLEQLLIN